MSASKSVKVETMEGFKQGDKVKLTKLNPVEKPACFNSEDKRNTLFALLVPGTNTLYDVIGTLWAVPAVGHPVLILDVLYNGKESYPDWHTTRVMSIEGDTFHTKNSVYKIEKLNDTNM